MTRSDLTTDANSGSRAQYFNTFSHICSLFDSSVSESRTFCVSRDPPCLIVLRYRVSESETAVQKVLKTKKMKAGADMNPAQIELCILLCLVYVSWGLTDSIQVKITTIFTHKNTIRDGGSPALYTAYTVFTVCLYMLFA